MKTTELIYPLTLSGGFVATLKLPINLSKEDAEKISALVFALASSGT